MIPMLSPSRGPELVLEPIWNGQLETARVKQAQIHPTPAVRIPHGRGPRQETLALLRRFPNRRWFAIDVHVQLSRYTYSAVTAAIRALRAEGLVETELSWAKLRNNGKGCGKQLRVWVKAND